ncbi:MAG: GntR family transcriptional regulator [Bacteroidetes bacterium CG2_30_32_10]|nr:MAG: GntR family transcriptional regulator [Bacteroidetes bacterium CG2_30_32_10]
MIELGKYNTLEVRRKTSVGLFLSDREGNELLLPNKYIPEGIEIGEEIKVFVYKDSEDRIIGTTLTPKVFLHQFAYMKVEMISQHGAFLDWGLEKQLFVPFREQARKMEEGKWYIIYMYRDEESDRLVASSKINGYLDNDELTVKVGDQVDILICESTDLGINVIINNIHKGLIYHNELFAKVNIGDIRKGYIKNIREDNKIDVQLQKQGYGNVEPSAQIILEKLKANGGFLELTDASAPEDIAKQLEMSKKTFKKAIGSLYKNHLINIEQTGIRWIMTE